MTCTGVQLSGACQTFARSASETRCMARALDHDDLDFAGMIMAKKAGWLKC